MEEDAIRADWVKEVERRFPTFEGRNRITTMVVEGGLEAKTFSDPSVPNGANIKKLVQNILHLEK